MELADAIGVVSSVLTLALFLTGVPICMKITRTKSTVNVASVPFLAGLFNTGLWLNYGILTGNPMVYVVSFIGAVLHVLYVVVYYSYCPNQPAIFKAFVSICLGLLGFMSFTNLKSELSTGVWLAGLVACVATIGFIAAPLADLGTVMKTKSTATIPLPMVIGNTVLSILYTWYGILIQDTFMLIPNFIGTVVSIFTLSLFFIYPTSKTSSKKD